MKKYFYTLCHAIPAALGMLCICLSAAAQDADTISGKIVDMDGGPVIGADCILYSLPDTVKVAWTPTDSSGRFMIPAKDGERYFLVLSMMSFEPIKMECGASDTVEVVMRYLTLDEVVVTPQVLSTFGNQDKLLLTESARKVGSNALDAISSLPQFTPVRNIGDGLSTAGGKSVLILIDGIRSSSMNLAGLQSDDIKDITYYSNPPVRFAHENVGAVIEVTTKKKVDRRYTLYLNTLNSVTTGYGDNSLYLTYTDSLNMVTAYYYLSFRDYNSTFMNNRYEYPDVENNYRGISGGYNGQFHRAQATYQRYQNKNLFNAKIDFVTRPTNTEEYTQEIIRNNGLIQTNSRLLQSSNTSLSVDLYYSYIFNKNRSLSFNVVNTYGVSDSYNNLASDTDYGYIFENIFDNRSYSLIAEALYTDKLWNGNFSAGVYYQYKNLNQVYNSSSTSRIDTHKEYIFADYSNGVGKFSYNIGLGLENNHYSTASNNVNYLIFRPSLALNMQLNKVVSMRLSSAIYPYAPTLGELTGNSVTIDERFQIQGNPDLKPYYLSYSELGMQLMTRDRKFYFAPQIMYYYYPGQNVPVLHTDGINVIQRTERIHNSHKVGALLTFTYAPVKWLSIRPYYIYTYSMYTTPNKSVRHHLHNLSIDVRFLPNNWEIRLFASFPKTLAVGDIYQKIGVNGTFSVLWKYKAISIGADYSINPNPSRIYANIDGFSYSEETIYNNLRHLATLKFTLYLKSGKSRSHADRRLNNSDNDTGLTDYNTAKSN